MGKGRHSNSKVEITKEIAFLKKNFLSCFLMYSFEQIRQFCITFFNSSSSSQIIPRLKSKGVRSGKRAGYLKSPLPNEINRLGNIFRITSLLCLVVLLRCSVETEFPRPENLHDHLSRVQNMVTGVALLSSQK